jgi:hypothetical protein
MRDRSGASVPYRTDDCENSCMTTFHVPRATAWSRAGRTLLVLSLLSVTMGASATEAGGQAMDPSVRALFDATIARVNDEERAQRVDYHAYLVQQGRADESLQQHIAKYASFARFGEAADEAAIEALQSLSGPPLPEALRAFYRGVGSFDGGQRLKGLLIHAPATLVERAKPDADQPWNLVRSLGLAHMVRWSWGGDRPEFDPASGEGLDADEADALNRDYSVIGWSSVEETEGFRYLYFDRAGRFGILYYHQDAFGEVYEDALKPLLAGRGPTMSLDEALRALIEDAQTSDFEE